jgi:hypothetical protein
VSGLSEKEELYRRLEQSRRLSGEASDPTTQSRLKALVVDLQQQIVAAEAKDADAPPE